MRAPRLSDLDWRTCAALFVASFASGIFQLYCLRLSYAIFGPLHENFAVILTSAICGVAVGSSLSIANVFQFRTIAWGAAAAAGLFALMPSAVIHAWSHAAGAGLGEAGEPAVKALLLLFYPLPVFIAFGALVPVALRAQDSASPQRAGQLLAISSFGNGCGSLVMILLLYQYVTLPVLGLAISGLLVVSGLIVTHERPVWAQAAGAVALCAAVIGMVLQFWPWAELSFGYRVLADHEHLRTRKAAYEHAIVYKAYGQDASLISFAGGERTLVFNGYLSLTFGPESRSELHEALVGATPVLFGRDTSRALVLGLGTGITGGSTATLYTKTRIAEINPAIFRIPPHFRTENQGLLARPSAEIELQDGISALLGGDETYDAIVNTVTSPHYYSAGKLYSADFFELVRSRLNEGGIYSGWFDLRIGPDGVSIMLNTLEAVFPHCRYFLLSQGYFNVLCGEGRLIYQPTGVIEERIGSGRIRKLFAKLGLRQSFAEILSDLEIDFSGAFFERRRDDVNTLDRPVIEFVVSRSADQEAALDMLNKVVDRNIAFRRKLSFAGSDFTAACRTIEEVGVLRPEGCEPGN